MVVLFYSDSAVFGGHEIMAVKAAQSLLLQPGVRRVHFLHFEGNARLAKELRRLASTCPKLCAIAIRNKTAPLQGIRTLFSLRKLMRLKVQIASLGPDVAVVVQGTIEAGSTGLLACRLAGVRTCSYIPVCHSYRFMRAKFGLLRDLLDRKLYYALPDKFITVSARMADLIRATGTNAEVAVVPNCVAPVSQDPDRRSAFRVANAIRENDYVAAVIGRIHFQQKAQDFLLTAVSENRQRLSGVQFLVVGNGPDEHELKARIHALGLERIVRMLPWTDNIGEILSAIDLLVIPSRFEGVPLVMLEAMSAGVPIVASAVDGMADLLPREWLFNPGSTDSLAKILLRAVRNDCQDVVKTNREFVLAEFTEPKFSQSLWSVLNGSVCEPASLMSRSS